MCIVDKLRLFGYHCVYLSDLLFVLWDPKGSLSVVYCLFPFLPLQFSELSTFNKYLEEGRFLRNIWIASLIHLRDVENLLLFALFFFYYSW